MVLLLTGGWMSAGLSVLKNGDSSFKWSGTRKEVSQFVFDPFHGNGNEINLRAAQRIPLLY